MDIVENPKCSTCRKEWNPDKTDIKNGKLYKTCNYCRKKSADYYKNNPEKVKEGMKKEYKKNAVKFIKRTQQNKKKNTDKKDIYRKNKAKQ